MAVTFQTCLMLLFFDLIKQSKISKDMITKLHLGGCINGHLFALKVTPGVNRWSWSRFSDTRTLKCYVLNWVEHWNLQSLCPKTPKPCVVIFCCFFGSSTKFKIQLLHNLHYITVQREREKALLASLSKFLPWWILCFYLLVMLRLHRNL